MTPQVNRRSNHDWIWEVHAGHSPWHLGRRAFHFPISQRVESDFFFAHIFWDWIEKDNRKITLGFKWHLYFCPFLDSRLRAISRHFLRPSSNGPPTDPPKQLDDAPKGEVQVPARKEPSLWGRLSCKVHRRAFEWRQEPGAWGIRAFCWWQPEIR